ncbi:MAG: tRNA (guanosine(46)-N7)-methyltransferase TrmB [Arcobacter sp.]|nr:tRNA (guanosine(46)-N7)-methyltransferase TrmB [Arcobacter sp.]
MPHIVFKKKELINTPSSLDGVDFEFIAKSFNFTNKDRKTEYKAAAKIDNKEFLLTIKDKDEDKYLLKFDKTTRVSPVRIIKKALNSYVKLNNSEILFSNTNNTLDKNEIQNKYLKDINYFVDEFNTNKEIYIEIGFGSGRHLLHQAKANPNIQFIGLEIHTPSIEQVLKQLELQDIKNVLIVNYDARLFMEFIKSNQVGKIFVHFPVPWDKKPHRRIYSNAFINEALRVLKVQGTLELRTDSRKYFDYCTNLLTNLPKGNISIDINKDLEISSKYEDRWKKQGKNIYDVILKSFSQDENRNIEKDFTFNEKIKDFKSLVKNIQTNALVEKDFFVHIENLFIIEQKENSGLIQVTMGHFDRPISKFLLIEDGIVSYFQGNPIPTSSNINAHKKIKELLKND